MPRCFPHVVSAGALVLSSLTACDASESESITDPQAGVSATTPSDAGGQEPSDRSSVDEEPTAQAPDIPAPDPADFTGMDENTPKGAEQAYRYYIALSL